MPAIVFLKRSWSFASDDLVFSSIVDILARLTCLIMMGIPFVFRGNVDVCFRDAISFTFFCLVFGIDILAVLLDIVLTIASSKGGPMEVSKRRHVPSILLAVCIASLCVVPVLVTNIYFSTTFTSTCPRSVFCAYLAGNALQLIFLAQYLACLLLQFRRSGVFWREVANTHFGNDDCVMHSNVTMHAKREAREVLSRSVQRRLKIMSTISRSRSSAIDPNTDASDPIERDAISSVADLFSDMFYDVNLVASDIVAGLLLLRWQTCQWVGSGHLVPWSAIERDSITCNPVLTPGITQHGDSNSLPSYEPTDWLAIDRLKRVSQMGVSLYGKLFYFLRSHMSPKSLCTLCRHLTCTKCTTRCVGSVGDISVGCCLCAGDNCELTSVLEMGDLAIGDLVAISFENTVYQSPYFVAIDDKIRCIVVAVRGTLSLEDALVDLLYDGVRLEEVEANEEQRTGCRPEFVGHRGMVATSRRLYERLTSTEVLTHARQLRPDYPLIVCGHSLGAGIASFLTLLLRPIYPEVKGYALSAPLGMMNSELAEFCKPFLVSIIYGFDAFARMNKSTALDFKCRLLDALSACTVPKYRLISHSTRLCFARWCCKKCESGCCPLPQTVGRDARLLDAVMQRRLIYPLSSSHIADTAPQSPSNQQGFIHADGTGDTNPTDHLINQSRLLATGRSLLRWMDPTKSDQLYGAYHSSTLPASDGGDTAESQVYDMRDGVFGGLVLHLLDVDPNIGLSHTSDGSFSPVGSKNDGMDTKSLLLNQQKSHVQSDAATVAIWTTPEQFKTLLVHPRMFSDHVPHNFFDAINRVHNLTTSPSSYPLKPNEVFRTTIRPPRSSQ